MSPLDRRRRRRAPHLRATIAAGVAALVVLLLFVGGVVQVGPASRPFWAAVDRSYAAGARPLVHQSDALGAQLRALLPTIATTTRATLEAQLDDMVTSADALSTAASALSPPTPGGGLGSGFAHVFSERATALSSFRETIDRLLAMTPLPVVGTPDSSVATPHRPPPSISDTAAASALARVGARLENADRSYDTVRRGFHSAPGAPALPASKWVASTAGWSPSGAHTLVGALVGSAKLAPLHDVVLLTQALSLTPAPLPPGATPPPAGTSSVPPTHSLRVTAVVANTGDVAEWGIAASASVALAGSSPVVRRSGSLAVAAKRTKAVTLPPLPVRPGQTYTVTVDLTVPHGEVAGAVTTETFVVAVAPGTPKSTHG